MSIVSTRPWFWKVLFVLALGALASACGSSSRSFGEIGYGTGTTTPATLTSISVEPTNTSLPRGLTRQFTAMAVYSDGTKLDVSSSVTWSSSAATTATITTTGVLTAVNLGATTVSAAIGTVTGSTTLTVSAATLVSIEVTPVSPTIGTGTPQQLTATGVYTDFSTQTITTAVTWSSSNPLIATISNAPGTVGVATGVSGGTATMTATLGAATGSTMLTVSGAPLLSINVTPAVVSIAKGGQQQFTATGVYSDGTLLPLTSSVIWSSSSAAATISNVAGSQGLATAAAVGTATISATVAGLTGTATLTVTAASLVSIAVTPLNPTIPKGLTQQFIATGTYSDGTTGVITATAVWASATPAVASITNAPAAAGIATGLAQGTTLITATVGTIVSPPATLTVSPAALVSIAVTPANPSVVVGANPQFTATGTYTDNSMVNITTLVAWTSGTITVATISNAAGPPSTQGVATAVAPGHTVITATYPATTISGSTTLTVKSAYAYATNIAAQQPGTISQYSIGAGGALTPLQTPQVPAGYSPFSIATVTIPSGSYAYVANYNKYNIPADSTISQYAISPIDGSLSPIGTPLNTASHPNSVTVDPSGHYVYVSNNTETTVSEYVIQPDGTLANPPGVVGIGGALFPAGAGPNSIAINPMDTFAYVANYDDGTVSQYSIGAGGALLPIVGNPTVNAQTGASYVLVDPLGNYVYVTNQQAGTVSEYSIGTDGSLSNIGTTPVSATTNGPSFIAIDAASKHAYVADSTSDDVSQYTIVNGILTPMAVPSVMTGVGSAPYGVTIDATGKYLYVADRITPGVISQFAISPVDGSLTPLAPPTAPAGASPTSIVTTH
jgi:6-phosphogluconolactonase (cycloisomerase 2 family)